MSAVKNAMMDAVMRAAAHETLTFDDAMARAIDGDATAWMLAIEYGHPVSDVLAAGGLDGHPVDAFLGPALAGMVRDMFDMGVLP